MSSDKRKALGRGLSALLPGGPPVAAAAIARRDYFVCAIEEVHPSGDNPRNLFDEAAMQELADSIREHGLLQPLVVRTREQGDGFTLIAGERRWRAAQRAGLKDVPVVVKETSATEAFELALVENLQRKDLNPIEEADAFRRLADDYAYTHDQIARRVGKDRSTVANALRLLKLPVSVRALVVDGRLQMGHARALLAIEEAPAMQRAAEQVVREGMSVRQIELLVRKLRQPTDAPPRKKGDAEPVKSPNTRDLEARLQRSLGVPVTLHEKGQGAGQLQIDYANLDELDRVLDKLLKP